MGLRDFYKNGMRGKEQEPSVEGEEILEKIPEYRSLYETQSDERENAKVETENRKTVSEHTEERRSGR